MIFTLAYNPLFLWQLIPTACRMAIALAHLAPRAPGSNLAVLVNRAIDDRPAHTAGGHLLSVVQAATNTERLWTQY